MTDAEARAAAMEQVRQLVDRFMAKAGAACADVQGLPGAWRDGLCPRCRHTPWAHAWRLAADALKAEVERISSLLASSTTPQPSDWQPITTAPIPADPDRTPILGGWFYRGNPSRWVWNRCYYSNGWYSPQGGTPTHWMPLPAPPGAAASRPQPDTISEKRSPDGERADDPKAEGHGYAGSNLPSAGSRGVIAESEASQTPKRRPATEPPIAGSTPAASHAASRPEPREGDMTGVTE